MSVLTDRGAIVVAALIEKRMNDLGMNQYQLAKASTVEQGHLSKILSGEYAMPRKPTRDKLARVLRLQDEDFFRAAGIIQTPSEPPPSSGLDDNDIIDDLWVQFREMAPPDALDVLREIKINERPEVYRASLRALVEAFAANAGMGAKMLRMLPRLTERTD